MDSIPAEWLRQLQREEQFQSPGRLHAEVEARALGGAERSGVMAGLDEPENRQQPSINPSVVEHRVEEIERRLGHDEVLSTTRP